MTKAITLFVSLMIWSNVGHSQMSCSAVFSSSILQQSQMLGEDSLYSPFFYQAVVEVAKAVGSNIETLELFIGNTNLTRADYHQFASLIYLYYSRNLNSFWFEPEFIEHFSAQPAELIIADIEVALASLSLLEQRQYIQQYQAAQQLIRANFVELSLQALEAGPPVISVGVALAALAVGTALTGAPDTLNYTVMGLSAIATLSGVVITTSALVLPLGSSITNRVYRLGKNAKLRRQVRQSQRAAQQLWQQGREVLMSLPHSQSTTFNFEMIYENLDRALQPPKPISYWATPPI